MTFNNEWFYVHTTDFIYNPYQSSFTLNGLWHTTMETSHRLSRDSIIILLNYQKQQIQPKTNRHASYDFLKIYLPCNKNKISNINQT